MKAFITKYALTKGILEREVNACNIPNTKEVVRDATNFFIYYHAGEWYKTWVAAAAKAEDMRQKKIISLQNQIRKLDYLEFKREGA